MHYRNIKCKFNFFAKVVKQISIFLKLFNSNIKKEQKNDFRMMNNHEGVPLAENLFQI